MTPPLEGHFASVRWGWDEGEWEIRGGVGVGYGRACACGSGKETICDDAGKIR